MSTKPNAWAAMNREWTEEVAAVLASERLPWSVTSAWCEQRSGGRWAEVTHQGNGTSRQIFVSVEHDNPAARREEIVRQLQNGYGTGTRR